MAKIEKIKGAERRTVTFTYDPNGRRIGKQLITTTGEVTKIRNWSYVYDNDAIVLEVLIDDSGQITKPSIPTVPECVGVGDVGNICNILMS